MGQDNTSLLVKLSYEFCIITSFYILQASSSTVLIKNVCVICLDVRRLLECDIVVRVLIYTVCAASYFSYSSREWRERWYWTCLQFYHQCICWIWYIVMKWNVIRATTHSMSINIIHYMAKRFAFFKLFIPDVPICCYNHHIIWESFSLDLGAWLWSLVFIPPEWCRSSLCQQFKCHFQISSNCISKSATIHQTFFFRRYIEMNRQLM